MNFPERIGLGIAIEHADGGLAQLVLSLDCGENGTFDFFLDEVKAAALIGQLQAILFYAGVPAQKILGTVAKARDLMADKIEEAAKRRTASDDGGT